MQSKLLDRIEHNPDAKKEEQNTESDENNPDIEKDSELDNDIIRRDDEMEVEPQGVIILEFGEDVPTPFRKVLNTIRQTSTPDKIQDPRGPEILGDSEILGSLDNTGEDDRALSLDY